MKRGLDLTKRIVLNLQGGLGNQLFQFFAGLEIALRTGSNLKINTTYITKGISTNVVDLQDIQLPFEHLLTWTSRSRSAFYFGRIWAGLSKSSILLRLVDRYVLKNFRSQTVGWDSEVDKVTIPVRLSGYFQTYRHFYRLTSKNASLSLNLKHPSDKYLNYKTEIEKIRPIVLHIRRGDYVCYQDYYGLLSTDYYASALNFLSNFLDSKETSIWVFTDDLALTAETLTDALGYSVRVIDVERNLSASETLLLMSKGSAIISANSTFSYWALMQSSPDSIKIVPETWYQNSLDPVDLIPSDWIRLPSHWT